MCGTQPLIRRFTITGLDQWNRLVNWTSRLVEIVCKPVTRHGFRECGVLTGLDPIFGEQYYYVVL